MTRGECTYPLPRECTPRPPTEACCFERSRRGAAGESLSWPDHRTGKDGRLFLLGIA